MVFQSLTLQVNVPGVTYALAALAIIVVCIDKLSRRPNLDAIPTVGRTGGWFGFLYAGLDNLKNIKDVVQEGYEKYESAPFKFAEPYQWVIVLSNLRHIEELTKAPSDVFTLQRARDEQFNTEYTIDKKTIGNPYHVQIIRSRLTRNVGRLFPDIRDEIITSLDDVLGLTNDEWKCIPTLNAMRKVICRTSNRMLVGLPLCRNPDWVDLNINFTIDIITEGIAVGLFPSFLRPLAARFVAKNMRRGLARGFELAGPIIEDRLRSLNADGGDQDGLSNDLLSWMIADASDAQLDPTILARRLLVLNFATVHSSSNTIASTLFYLAAYPQYMQPLREEVASIVAREGWTQTSVRKMHRIDSFIKECHRFEGTNALNVFRKALKDVVLSDGTFIPSGSLVTVGTRPIAFDERLDPDVHAFQPWRYVAHGPDGESTKRYLVTTAVDDLNFGHGRHACPGRFFAANMLKTMLAHVVLTYDLKLEGGATLSTAYCFGAAMGQNPHARVLIRKRGQSEGEGC